MKKSYTREKKTLCGEGYMEVDLYRITPEEHAAKRRKKGRPSSERQKKRNAQHAHRWRVQKANANFTVLGFYLTLTYIDAFLPESMEQAQRDLRNYIRRVKAAIAKLYGPGAELRAKERAVPPSPADRVQRTDHTAECGVPAAAGGQMGRALAGRQRGEPRHSQRRPVKSAKQAGRPDHLLREARTDAVV